MARLWLRRGLDLLAPLGLLVIVGAEAWRRSATRPLPGQPRWYFLAGAALVLAHLVLRWDDIAARLGRRQMRYGANTAVLVVAGLAILGGLNYLAARHSKQWDLTKGRRHSLSEQTRKVVGGLQEEVTLTYFEKSDRMEEGRARLEQYAQLSPRLKVAYVDPVVTPGPAREHEITGPTVLVQRGGRREKVQNVSEQDLTNAIIKVTREGRKTVCFVEGQGERDIEDSSQRGLSRAKEALSRSQYETRKVFLAREGAVPAECTVLVVAGPERDFFAAAVESIRRFVKAGGKALLLLEPELRGGTPNLTSVLAEWNLQAGGDVVVDSSGMGQIVGGGALTPVVLSYPWHEITKDLRDVMTVFHTARSVQAGAATSEGLAAQNLAETFNVAWAETDLALKQPVRFDEGKDRAGPVSLAAVATLSGPALSAPGASPPPAPSPSPALALEGPVLASPGPPPSPVGTPSAEASPAPQGSPEASPSPPAEEAKREGRVAVFGDVDFASNALLAAGNLGNQDLFLNTVAWLAQDPDLISIRPREPDDQRLFLTRQQQDNIGLLSQILLPGALLALGVASWWRRRA